MNSRILLLVFLVCMTAGPVPAASTGDYLGSGIQLGGQGTSITHVVTTAIPSATATATSRVVAPTGSLSINTTPRGASIVIDGTLSGISPATISGLSPGSHTLLLRLNGYEEVSAPVTITAGQTQTYSTALSPVVTAAAATYSRPATKKTPGFEPALALFAMGVILALKKLS